MVQLTPVQEVAVGNGVNTSAHASLDYDIQQAADEMKTKLAANETLHDHFMVLNAGLMEENIRTRGNRKNRQSGFVDLADPVASAGKVIDAQFHKELKKHANDPNWHGPLAEEYMRQQSMYGNKVNNPYVPEVAKTGSLAANHDFCDDVFLNTEHLTSDGHAMSVCENNPAVIGDTAGGCAPCGVVNILGADVQLVPQVFCDIGCWVTNASHYLPVIAGAATALVIPTPSGARWFFGLKLGAGVGVYVLAGGRFGGEFK
jgi:hypothetical protein